MKFDPVKIIHIYYKPMGDKIFVGQSAFNSRKVL